MTLNHEDILDLTDSSHTVLEKYVPVESRFYSMLFILSP